MRYVTFIFVLMALLALIVGGGCERKVTNEIVDDDPNFTGADACMGCHGDDDLTLVAAQAQWENSKHGIGETSVINANIGDAGCQGCHTAEGFLAIVTGVPADASHFSSIGCFTCHAPHSTGTLGLRKTTPYTLGNGEVFDKGDANLCAQCHHSRRNVNTYVADSVKLSTHYGPHYSPQADLLIGTGGYEYEGYTYRTSPHGTVTVQGCIDCHMSPSIGVVLGGHTWNMEAETVEGEMKNTVGCNTVNCHDGALEETFNYDGFEDSVLVYFDSLGQELFASGMLSYNEDSTLIPTADFVIKGKDSVGAVYNYRFVYQDHSHGIHNSKYALDLLKSALAYMQLGAPATPIAATVSTRQ